MSQALDVCAQLARSMGRPLAREGRSLLDAALPILADKRAPNRAAASAFLTAAAEACGLDWVVGDLKAALAQTRGGGEAKQAAAEFLATALPQVSEGGGWANAHQHMALDSSRCFHTNTTLPLFVCPQHAASLCSASLADVLLCCAAAVADKGPGAREAGAALTRVVAQAVTPDALGQAMARLRSPANREAADALTAALAKAGVALPGPTAATAPALTRTRTGAPRDRAAGAPSRSASVSASTTALPRASAALAAAAAGGVRASAAATLSAPTASAPEPAFVAVDPNKPLRARRLRVVRVPAAWSDPRADEAASESLAPSLAPFASPSLVADLLSPDFPRHCAAADRIAAAALSQFDCVAGSLDLVLYWAACRLCEPNTQARARRVGAVAMAWISHNHL